MTQKTYNNVRFKLNITKLNVNVYNIDNVDIAVKEIPQSFTNTDNTILFTTSFCDINSQASIEIVFSEIIANSIPNM